MRARSCLAAVAVWSFYSTAVAPDARAFEFFDGRLQVHGYYEAQLRGFADDFHPENAVMSQWANVFSLELEADIAPDGFGPFDMISAFSRVTVRYDCIYNGCGMLPTWRYWGDRANRVPRNWADGYTNPYNGTLRSPYPTPGPDGQIDVKEIPQRKIQRGNELIDFFAAPPFDVLVDLGAENVDATFAPIRDARFTFKDIDASVGNGSFAMGPWNPDTYIDPSGSLDVVPNVTLPLPLRPLMAPPGSGGMYAHGLFVPSRAYVKRYDEFDEIEQNYTQSELAWNHVQSQDERELKEAYFDVEAFEGRLWMRAGKQNIVWGKTELFRTTDQFNPQTLALSSLPSLEDSRIALWSLRGTWSFYDVGPLEDLRLELAVNLDDFEPLDLGRCGTPYTIWLVCGKTFGYWAHGFAGAGLAGDDRPQDWWESPKGLEFGARLEWRWDRFSFQLSDFWGYEDAPVIDTFNEYERKVDPFTGRPLDVYGNPLVPGQNAAQILALHPGNRQLFDVVCSATKGIAKRTIAALGERCLLDIVNDSEVNLLTALDPESPLQISVTAAEGLSAVLGGNPASGGLVLRLLMEGITPPPLVELNRDINDGRSNSVFGPNFGVAAYLTDQQEALLGCGPFYGTDCDLNGIDVFNAEASVLLQAFPQFEPGGPVATRFVPGTGSLILPGARGPGDPGYDPGVDGCTSIADSPVCASSNARPNPALPPLGARTLVNPLDGQLFANEMGALSYNFMMILAGLGFAATEPDGFTKTDPACNPNDPFTCAFVRGVFAIAGARRPEVRAGGNGIYGRRDFIWSGGSQLQIRYQKRNVLGFATDFAHDGTGTNWSIEATWMSGQPYTIVSEPRGWGRRDTYNLTVSVDRPTFVNFLNPNRTFFLNSQIFFRWIDDYVGDNAMGVHGPFAMLGTFTIATGYHQDRLLPAVTWVHDVMSASGALVGQVSYRFTQDFSVTFGIAGFYGDPDEIQVPLVSPLLANQGGDWKSDNRYDGLSALSERDEAFLLIRYTF
jgi:hypothetical protein